MLCLFYKHSPSLFKLLASFSSLIPSSDMSKQHFVEDIDQNNNKNSKNKNDTPDP